MTNLNSQVQQAVPWTRVRGRFVRAGANAAPPPRYLIKIKWGFFFPSAELQAIIDEKNIELANKSDELRKRSVQSHRRKRSENAARSCVVASADGQRCLLFLPVLLIIQMQADIEKLSKTAEHDVDFKKIKGGFPLHRGYGHFTQQLMTQRVGRTPRPLERDDRWNRGRRQHQTA